MTPSFSRNNLAWSKSEDTKLTQLLKDGRSYAEAAIVLKRKEAAVQQRASKLKIAVNSAHKAWTGQDKELLIKMLKNGKSIAQVSAIINRNELAIYSFLRRNRIKIRTIKSFDVNEIQSNKLPAPHSSSKRKTSDQHRCLRCHKWFKHKGVGNHICPRCTSNKPEEARGLPEYFVGKAI